MNIDFPLILVILTFVCGLIYLADILFFARQRKKTGKKMPVIIDYGRSFFPVFLIVLVIRSFIVSPYRVPTGSLEPTVLPNDLILVNQFAYGLRLPVLNTKFFKLGEPQTGDIAVFRFPGNPKVNYIKRVIGVPGDHIVYQNKVLTINGKEIPQKYLRDGMDVEPGFVSTPAVVKQEILNGDKHEILVKLQGGSAANYDLVVPKGYYFMMGDNRDGSADSRYWGFVPEQNLVGKAFLIWFSWGKHIYNIRWSRIGTIL